MSPSSVEVGAVVGDVLTATLKALVGLLLQVVVAFFDFSATPQSALDGFPPAARFLLEVARPRRKLPKAAC